MCPVTYRETAAHAGTPGGLPYTQAHRGGGRGRQAGETSHRYPEGREEACPHFWARGSNCSTNFKGRIPGQA